MKALTVVLGTVLVLSAAAFAADQQAPSLGKALDQQISMVEHEFVPLVEAMPADKMGFAPTAGEFKGVRTFGEQAKHVAAVMYIVSAAVLGEKNPSAADGEAGPASAKSKDDIVKYVKDAFAYAHRAAGSLTNESAIQLIDSPFGGPKVMKSSAAEVCVWHSFDHYGQMVVYARMNGIVPPASRR